LEVAQRENLPEVLGQAVAAGVGAVVAQMARRDGEDGVAEVRPAVAERKEVACVGKREYGAPVMLEMVQ